MLRFPILGEFGLVVDSCLRIVVLHPAHMPQVPDIHVQALEGDARRHDPVELVGFDLDVEQAIAERWPVDHLGLGAGY